MGGCRLGLRFCPSAWVCEFYVSGHNPGIAIMGVGGSDLSAVGVCGDGFGGV